MYNDTLLTEAVESIVTQDRVARRVVRQTRVDEKAAAALAAAEAAGAAVNDGIPPSVPANVQTYGGSRSIQVKWDAPVGDEYVQLVVVEARRNGAVVHTAKAAPDIGEIWMFGLDPLSYDLYVKNVDQWGLESPFVGPLVTVAKPSVADQIKDDIKIAAGSIVPYLPGSPATPSILSDPSIFAEKMFEWTQMMGESNTNLLPTTRAIFDGWTTKDSSNATRKGRLMQPSIGPGLGSAASIRVENGEAKFRFTTLAGGTEGNSYIFPFLGQGEASWVPAHAGNKFIGVCDVRRASGTEPINFRLSIQTKRADGSFLRNIEGDLVVLDTDSTRRAMIRWEKNTEEQAAGVSYTVFYRAWGPSVGQSIHVNRNYLDVRADTVDLGSITEPPRFTLPVFAQDIISARMLNALDVTAARAIIGDLAVESAKIGSLSVSKLEAGNLAVSLNITSGGAIITPGITLNSRGAQLLAQNTSAVAYPSTSTSDWILAPNTPSQTPTPHSGITFFSQYGGPGFYARRGVLISADGVSGSEWEGWVRMQATSGSRNASDDSSVTLSLMSGKDISTQGLARLIGDFEISRGSGTPNRFIPQSSISATSIGGGGTQSFTHGLGYGVTRMVFLQVRDTSGSDLWYGIATGMATGVRWHVREHTVLVENTNTTTRVVRGWVNRG